MVLRNETDLTKPFIFLINKIDVIAGGGLYYNITHGYATSTIPSKQSQLTM